MSLSPYNYHNSNFPDKMNELNDQINLCLRYVDDKDKMKGIESINVLVPVVLNFIVNSDRIVDKQKEISAVIKKLEPLKDSIKSIKGKIQKDVDSQMDKSSNSINKFTKSLGLGVKKQELQEKALAEKKTSLKQLEVGLTDNLKTLENYKNIPDSVLEQIIMLRSIQQPKVVKAFTEGRLKEFSVKEINAYMEKINPEIGGIDDLLLAITIIDEMPQDTSLSEATSIFMVVGNVDGNKSTAAKLISRSQFMKFPAEEREMYLKNLVSIVENGSDEKLPLVLDLCNKVKNPREVIQLLLKKTYVDDIYFLIENLDSFRRYVHFIESIKDEIVANLLQELTDFYIHCLKTFNLNEKIDLINSAFKSLPVYQAHQLLSEVVSFIKAKKQDSEGNRIDFTESDEDELTRTLIEFMKVCPQEDWENSIKEVSQKAIRLYNDQLVTARVRNVLEPSSVDYVFLFRRELYDLRAKMTGDGNQPSFNAQIE